MQLCYLENVYFVCSDNRFLLLFSCPHGYRDWFCLGGFHFVGVYSHLKHRLSRLLLGGDVESNPGLHKGKNGQANSRRSTRSKRDMTPDRERAADESCSDSDDTNTGEHPTATKMFAQLLAGQQKLAQDIAEIKLFHQSVNNQFDALESHVAALEAPPRY